MKKKRLRNRIGMCCIAAALVLCALIVPVFADTDEQEPAGPEFTEFEQLNGKTIAMLTGAPFEELISSKVEEVGSFQYFNNLPDMVMALKNEKIDACLVNNAVGALTVNNDRELAIFPHDLGEAKFGFAFHKGSPERKAWQDAFDRIPQDTLTQLWEKWTGADESIKHVPEQDWPGSNGTIKVAACDNLPPMAYVGEEETMEGFDIEIILLMAKEMDVHVEFVGADLETIMPSVESGKTLFGTGSIIATKERKELVDFIEYHPAAFQLMVRSTEDEGLEAGFLRDTKESFVRTFVTESRYKMILSGLELTLLIAIVSGALGLALAFGLVFLRHRNRPVINRLISIYTNLVVGIPAVVILMVLYYIVFGALDLSAVVVVIIGFAILFGAGAYTVIWNASANVDPGQREAALALGYTERNAFKEIILPQSAKVFIPQLQVRFIGLVKETSIAGYITVVDLAKAGDLIRSRTLEAFFPLLVTAAIYFLLIWLIIIIMKQIQKGQVVRRARRFIKGVD